MIFAFLLKIYPGQDIQELVYTIESCINYIYMYIAHDVTHAKICRYLIANCSAVTQTCHSIYELQSKVISCKIY